MAISKKSPTDKKGTSHVPQLRQLSRIEGQVRGVSKMIEEQRYCLDIIHQIKAIRSSLAGIEKKVINEHLDCCLHRAVTSKDSKLANSAMDEIKNLLKTAKF